MARKSIGILRSCGLAASAAFMICNAAGPTRPAATTPAAAPKPVAMMRLDCGSGQVPRAFLSDTFAFAPGAMIDGVVSCYLIRHGDSYLLWDAGLPHAFGKPATNPSPPGMGFMLRRSLRDQLAELGIASDQVRHVAISHAHFDHIGQAGDFPRARLLIGAADFAAIRSTPLPEGVEATSVAPWQAPGSDAVGVAGDFDIFGDGSVMMLAMPGHTAGHHVLLVRLASQPVLLTGDLVHMRSQLDDGNISMRVEHRADAVSSIARIRAIATNLKAQLIVAHDPADVAKLPAFPGWAR